MTIINCALKLVPEPKPDPHEQIVGASSGLFNSPWGSKYRKLQGKVFQIMPSQEDLDYLDSPQFVLASEIFKTETGYIIKQQAQKVPYGAFVNYVAPLLHKMDRETDDEPILFGHIVLYKNSIIIVNVGNLESPYRGGW